MRRAFLFGLVGVLLATGCGGDDDGGASADNTAAPDTQAAGTAARDSDACRRVQAPKPRAEGTQRRPPAANLAPGKRYDVTFRTNCGPFTIEVDQKAAPATAASFVSLARKGFFDGTVFHRIVPGFVIQGGDPTGSGQGGPGYTTTDKPPADTVYERGMVAMAKTGEEPAGTAGSQFFVVTGQAPDLAPEYATLGRVTKGLGVVERIGQLGDPSSGGAGTPMEPVVIGRTKVSAY
ncbi:MAG TPA: peptidylprolyl isomerase [Thermoleophilaceae bacterium]|nr:peptidylprolyl isomerase [Thermoleophilaceae bacterium]